MTTLVILVILSAFGVSIVLCHRRDQSETQRLLAEDVAIALANEERLKDE